MLIVKLGSTFVDLARRRGDFEDWTRDGLGGEAAETLVVDPVAGETLPEPRDFAGIVVTGSHAMVTDRADWSQRTAEWLRGAIEAEVPLLGICYAHQLLAHAAGGAAGDNPAGLEYGTVEVELADAAAEDPLLAGLPPRFDVQVSHTQSALVLPPGAVCLAAGGREPHAAFRVGRCAWGVQFHPEFDADVTRTYVQQMAGALAADGQDAGALESSVHETPHCAAVLARFCSFATENSRRRKPAEGSPS